MNIIRKAEGHEVVVLRDRVNIKVASEQSPFGMSIVVVDVPPNSGTPCVAHAKEEEVYFILSGELFMHTPTERHTLRAGDMVHLPPGTPHGYRNPGDHDAQFLAWTVGGPMDKFFTNMAERVRALPDDLPQMVAVLEEFGVTRVA
ncbi:cupin domain-containing protein [Niveibacterium sp. SC-1]|uniref:cupin domain-containing protein n=1 Tax=Niveibacterium sp. SC-1 TaxID=3135646 RepID=UPI00311F4D26